MIIPLSTALPLRKAGGLTSQISVGDLNVHHKLDFVVTSSDHPSLIVVDLGLYLLQQALVTQEGEINNNFPNLFSPWTQTILVKYIAMLA